jgi:hypothetical protein
MRIFSLAAVAILVSYASVFAQTPSDSSTQYIPVTSFCSKAGVVWDAKQKRAVCSGAWTLTFQPPGGAAAHLVGGMSPIEVKAVLDATGVAYKPLEEDSLVVGREILWFGEQGLEAWGPNLAPKP